ncbi:uncharacterized protein [Maniola hyperantus]|uniref:uncharacterized protein n=1 Tax=Aphantopus hyperantus TaxID=2795564 RepID=UPI0037479C8A
MRLYYGTLVGGQGQYYPHTTTSTTSLPISTSMTEFSQPTTERIVGRYDYGYLSCDFGMEGLCAWKNDPGASRSWLLNPFYKFGGRMMGGKAAFPDRSAGIRVYQKPDYIALEDLVAYSDEKKKEYILFEVWGDWGDYWYEKESTLKQFDSNFQIILEGNNFGEDPMYMGIEFISINQRSACHGETALTPRTTASTSTTTTTTTMATTTIQGPLGIGFGTFDEFRCNFNKVDFCGWKNDPAADDDWFLSTNDRNYVDFYSEEGPGWFLYFDKASSSGNGTVRLISPLYSRDLEGSCFHFSYRIHTTSHGRSTGIRAYLKPEYLTLEDFLAYSDEAKKNFVLYDIWGDFSEEKYWSWNETKLMNVDYNFQIIIEGIYGQDNIYMALDDLIISGYPECTPSVAPTTSSSTTSPRPTTTTFSTSTQEAPRGVTGPSSTITTTEPTPASLTPTTSRASIAPQPTTNSLPTASSPPRPTTTHRPLQENDSLSCDFEYWELCGWKNDEAATGEWQSEVDDYEDEVQVYFYLFWSPWGSDDGSVRLVSPLYSRALERDGCFTFYYRIRSQNSSIGIRVYQKPDSISLEGLVASSDDVKKEYLLFENFQEQRIWYHKELTLKQFDSNFQIIIEGRVYKRDMPSLEIDDVAIGQGSNCIEKISSTTADVIPDSLSCDFQDSDLCGWKNDPTAFGTWGEVFDPDHHRRDLRGRSIVLYDSNRQCCHTSGESVYYYCDPDN